MNCTCRPHMRANNASIPRLAQSLNQPDFAASVAFRARAVASLVFTTLDVFVLSSSQRWLEGNVLQPGIRHGDSHRRHTCLMPCFEAAGSYRHDGRSPLLCLDMVAPAHALCPNTYFCKSVFVRIPLTTLAQARSAADGCNTGKLVDMLAEAELAQKTLMTGQAQLRESLQSVEQVRFYQAFTLWILTVCAGSA
jgi:hypothetical protein